MDNGQLVRYNAPTKFDTAEYGKMWVQMLDDGKEIYIQVSKDDTAPHWIRIGSFLEKVFYPKLYEESFIRECLDAYNS